MLPSIQREARRSWAGSIILSTDVPTYWSVLRNAGYLCFSVSYLWLAVVDPHAFLLAISGAGSAINTLVNCPLELITFVSARRPQRRQRQRPTPACIFVRINRHSVVNMHSYSAGAIAEAARTPAATQAGHRPIHQNSHRPEMLSYLSFHSEDTTKRWLRCSSILVKLAYHCDDRATRAPCARL